jgi:hypothetical protein
MSNHEYRYNKLFIHKLANVPSGISPAKQASRPKAETRWIPIENNYSSINSAQHSSQNMLHIPPSGGIMVKLLL